MGLWCADGCVAAGAADPRRVSACVNVWLARADVAVADDELDDHERGRALRFRHADLRRRFVAAHVTLRRLLSLHGAGRPAALHWPVAAGGKPGPVTLASGGLLHHNLSHAGEWIAVCISADCAVGVDVAQHEAWLKADGRGIATRHPVVHGGSPDDRRARLLVRLGHVVLACIAMCSEARSSSTSTTCIAPPMPWESRNVGGERVTQRLAQA
jgi:hypothetical protein